MDFELTDDQVALQEGVGAVLDGRFSLADVRAIEAAGHLDRERWQHAHNGTVRTVDQQAALARAVEDGCRIGR